MAPADDEISLEDLMSSTSPPAAEQGAAPSPEQNPDQAAQPATQPATQPEEASGPKAGATDSVAAEATTPEEDKKSVEFLDKVLAENDPQFVAQMQGIAAEKIETDQAIDSIEVGEMPSPAAPLVDDGDKKATGLKALKVKFQRARVWVNHRLDWIYEKRDRAVDLFHELRGPGLKLLLARSKVWATELVHHIKAAVEKIKHLIQDLIQLPRSAKLKLVSSIFLLAVFVFVLKLTLKGEILSRVEPQMLTSFALVADHEFEFAPDEVFENFYSPLRTPDAIVELEKIVVNLTASAGHPKPMGLFELYAAADSREAAIEIGDRKNDMKDRVSRVIEGLTYDEVADIEGKARMKLLIRKELNSELQSGKVKRVFIKTIVLKP